MSEVEDNEDYDLYLKAIGFAEEAHKGQKRKYSNEPYIVHPRNVSLKLNNYFEKTVALLHDVLEDTDIDFLCIRKNFTLRVALVVSMLTKIKGERYVDYINRIKKLSITSRIKLADLEDNLKDIPNGHQKDKYEIVY